MPTNNDRVRVGDRVVIYARGKKGIFCADFWHDGKHQRVSLDTRNRRVATQRAVKIDADLASGKYSSPPPPTTIEAGISKYIEYITSEGRARRTIERYRCELYGFHDFCHDRGVGRLGQITVSLFDNFRADRSKVHAPATLSHESIVVKQWLNWCETRKLVLGNPLQKYRIEKHRCEPRGGPSLSQVNTVLAAAEEPRRTQYAVLAFSGMRSGELRNLQCIDVDLEGNWLHIVSRPGSETKTRQSRKVPIHARLRALLVKMPQSKFTHFFTAAASSRYPAGGHWINVNRLNDDFLKILKEQNIPAGRKKDGFTIHSLRHFFKTHCVNSSIPKPVVDTWQGHKIDMTVGAQYYKLSDEDSQRFMKKVPFGTGNSAADAEDQ